MMTWVAGFFLLIVKLVLVLGCMLFLAAYLVWAERKLLARLQVRYGPNRAGKFGLLQPIADAIKMITKEDIVPAAADRVIFLLAPAVVAVTALLMFAVVPFGPGLRIWDREIPLVISDLNVGLLYVFALSSLGVYGVALGGWASNSKFALLGGIRGAAQMISYELSLGLSLVPIVMLARSFSLVDIVQAQADYPFILVQPISFIIFFVSAMAESKRIPFDLPEAENELGAGFHTEYSGMRFGLFFIGEYVHIQVLGALVAVFFLGGWRGPWLPPVVWLFVKIILIVLVMIWIRGTLPRLRYDQLMALGWKVLVPAALINIIITGAFILI
ncbi:MAG: NADH-quinone oxidoreductase subunit NuoH [Pseudomonadota bacterium]|uniref:NADH-quinone oxidoreductase subunit H n=1 Tax=Candidatus Desulfatibia profunda TaxID=2841695 RepID=A0A8J6NX15_9BACT|nr:NADH-quinone oxidoreductase subunit NuoH [Candidatus Desulfatibia profunda]MBL7180405.1 NADH-quinone oxidoreductase subunit NuoH [Desulfobacterales bacterium]